jgi:hypothetical protein
MSTKIGNIEQNYAAIDFTELNEDLKLASYEEMDAEEFEQALYKENGVVPAMVKKASAEKFGLRHAFFDVWQHESSPKAGVWILQKNEATGEEFIVKRAES